MNVLRVIRCQYGHWRIAQWHFIQKHCALRMFVFTYLRKYYTKLRYRNVFGYEMSLKKPKTFHEKMFWLSVNYRHPLIMQCADKYRVRDYVKKCGCGEILNELFGVYNNVEEIPFESLPKKFVIKNNRGSGDNFFCTDKGRINMGEIKMQLNDWENHEYGVSTAEYQYFKIPFKLICEKYLLEKDSDEMVEYQFFCFNGKPHSILVRNDLETAGKEQFAVSYSMDWRREYLRINEEQYAIDVPKPRNFDKMVDCAKRLCAPFPHVRVDFYDVDGQLYFGELTFSTHGNVFSNYKETTLIAWNELLSVPEKYTKTDHY